MSMYVCVYIYTCIHVLLFFFVCVCLYVCLSRCLSVRPSVGLSVCPSVCVCRSACLYNMYVCRYVYVHVYTYVATCMCMCICKHVCMYACTHVHVYIYIHILQCMYVCMYVAMSVCMSHWRRLSSPAVERWANPKVAPLAPLQCFGLRLKGLIFLLWLLALNLATWVFKGLQPLFSECSSGCELEHSPYKRHLLSEELHGVVAKSISWRWNAQSTLYRFVVPYPSFRPTPHPPPRSLKQP